MVPAALDVQYESGWRLKAFRIPFSINFLFITYLVSLMNYRDFNIAYIYIYVKIALLIVILRVI